MDLSTMRKKLDGHEYSNAQVFFANFKLMIHNCFHFDPTRTPVNLAGIKPQRLFDNKWKNLLQPKLVSLGARGQLPSGSMLSTWWVLKQFAQLLPSG